MMAARTNDRSRSGIALMGLMLVLAVLSTLLVSITWQVVASRRFLDHRHHQYQSEWLARSGLELGTARLMADSGFTGTTLEIIPDSRVTISIRRDPKTNVYEISSDAVFPMNDLAKASRTFTRKVRRREDKNNQIRMEVLP